MVPPSEKQQHRESTLTWSGRVVVVVTLVLTTVHVPIVSEANAAASIQRITPAQGPISGGTAVTLAGSGFTGAALTLDGAAVVPSSASDTQIVFQTPAHDNGIVTIKLSGNGPNAYAEFLYVPPRLQDLPPGYITTVAGIGLFTGLYRPAAQAEIQPQGSPTFDRQGYLYIPEPQNNRVTRVRPDGILEPFAGTGLPDYQSPSGIGDGGPATEASLTFPRGVTTDAAGNAYITEFRHRIRKVDARTGVITTIAGNGTPGFSGDGGQALQARLHDVTHITGDGNGTLYFIDFDDASSIARVRKITPDGIISTVAGVGPPGFSGDGGPATQAQFNLIYADRGSLALDPQGNLFIEDTGNDRIRRIDGRSGIITTVYGPAALDWGGVAADRSGNIFFWLDYRIFEMGPNGQILNTYGSATHSGSSQEDGTPIQNANISSYGLVIDPSGNIVYVESLRARRLNLGTGLLETLAGMGSRIIGDNGPAIATTLPYPTDITFLPTGELLIGDYGHVLVRKVDGSGNVSTFAKGGGTSFDRPLAIQSDRVGNVFVVDPWSAYRISSTGTVGLFAGRRQPCGYTGDGGPATEAFLCQPWDAAFDGAGNLYIADTNNNRIRRVDARTGTMTTVAGSGPVNGLEHYGSDGQGSLSGDGGPATQATLNTPYGVAVDSQGNLYIGDGDNRRIRKVDSNGIITTFATVTASGVGKLAFDSAGNLYAAFDIGLVRFDPSGRRTQLAGQYPPGFSGDGGPALQAKTRSSGQSVGVAVDAEGNVFFVDAGNQRIRAVRYGAVLAEPGSTVAVSRGSAQSTATGTVFLTVLQVILRSPAGTLENGIRVDFAAPTSGASCTFADGRSTFSTRTDINGYATAACIANSQLGSYSVTATPLALGQSASFVLTNTNNSGTTSSAATAVAGDGKATVTFTAPAGSGGSAGTVYTVISSPGGITVTDTANPITITGLNNGTSYTLTVTAVNAVNGSAYSAISNSVTPASSSSVSTATVDFSGDRKSDILWRNTNGQVAIWLMNGMTPSSGAIIATVGNEWTIAASGDFDGDGNSDILWRNSNGQVAIWLMNGMGQKSSAIIAMVSTDWTIAGTGDFDGDGKTDILWRNSNGQVAIWLMNGTTLSSGAAIATVGNEWKIATTGDFDGDGKIDILWRNSNGQVAIWLMNGMAQKSGAIISMVGNDWTISGLGDFDGDGKGDILWRNVSGEAAIWLMNGMAQQSAGSLGVISKDWKVAESGDFDGDGKDDILWRNDNGQVAIWLMNGAAQKASAVLGLVSTDWKVTGNGGN